MITQYEVPFLISREIPELDMHPELKPLMFLPGEIYSYVEAFTHFTKQAVEKHHILLAKKCFALAGKLYRLGEPIVRQVMENIFVFSFSSVLSMDRIEKLMIKTMIPPALYQVYIKQVTARGC